MNNISKLILSIFLTISILHFTNVSSYAEENGSKKIYLEKFEKASSLFKERKYKKIVSMMDELINSKQKSIPMVKLLKLRAQSYANLKELDNSISDLNKIIEIDNKNAEAYLLRANFKLRANRNDEILEDYERAIKYAKNDGIKSMALFSRAIYFKKQKNMPKAKEDAAKSAELNSFVKENQEAILNSF